LKLIETLQSNHKIFLSILISLSSMYLLIVGVEV